MKQNILDLLSENARISIAEIADIIGVEEVKVSKLIEQLEADNIIKGYKVILNEEALNEKTVRALIEVKVTPERNGGFDRVAKRLSRFDEVTDCYLISGDYDIRLEVKGSSLQDVATFVAERLSTLNGVVSTATLFLLKKYKESGKILSEEEEYEILKVSP